MSATVLGIDEAEIAQCVGLWLAEGDRKSNLELTFTNNSKKLIKIFHNTIMKIYDGKNEPRIYVYSPNDKKIKIVGEIKTNFYLDKRASKPYYIYRLADVSFLKEWGKIVKKCKNDKKIYPYILQGFFAGEGNIKTGSHKNRTLRISQGKKNKFVEKVLDYLEVKYRFSERGRSYIITGRKNLEKLKDISIAELHPEKNQKFESMMKSYKQKHYSKGELKNKVLKAIKSPKTSKELSKELERSQARIQRVLTNLKKDKKVYNFRVRSKDYWTKRDDIIIISETKKKYLDALREGLKRTFEFSKKFDVCPKSSMNRLKELKKLELVKRNTNKEWALRENPKEVIVL